MVTELEKQFFQCFGIEPHYYCADEYVFEAMLEYECTEGNREKCKTCKKVGKSYPQITDRILLELICFIEQIDLGRYGEYEYFCKFNYEDLRTEILAKSIRLAHKKAHSEVNGQLFYNQVRTLFKEG